jgi:hypothetical protein
MSERTTQRYAHTAARFTYCGLMPEDDQ